MQQHKVPGVQDQVLPDHGAMVVMFQNSDGAFGDEKAEAANWKVEFIADCGESTAMHVPATYRGWMH